MNNIIKKFSSTFFFKSYFMILLSAFFFTVSTVAAKYLNRLNRIGGLELSFARFFIGMIIVLFMRFALKKNISPVNKTGLYLRAFLNAGAVILFFLAVEYSTITNANILNMSYPVFVVLSAYIFLKEPLNSRIFFCLFLSLAGAAFIAKPFSMTFNFGDIFGLLSAVVSGLAITDLKYIRKTDNTFTIMYYLFLYGAIFTFIFCFKSLKIPTGYESIFIMISALSAIAGQFILTYGQKYCSATKGSIVSMSRIIFAGFFGVLLFDDYIDFYLIAGAFFIILPNIILFSKNE